MGSSSPARETKTQVVIAGRAVEAFTGAPAVMVGYGDLIADRDGVQKALAECTELDFNGSFRDVHLSDIPASLQYQLNGIRPLAADVARWNWEQHAARVV